MAIGTNDDTLRLSLQNEKNHCNIAQASISGGTCLETCQLTVEAFDNLHD